MSETPRPGTNVEQLMEDLQEALSEKSALQEKITHLEAIICDMEDKESMLIDNKRLRAEKEAYREALEEIEGIAIDYDSELSTADPEASGLFTMIIAIILKRKALALDRGPEEPVGREVMSEDLAKEILVSMVAVGSPEYVADAILCSSCKKWKGGWCSRKKAAADKDDKACQYGEKKEEK